MKLWEELQNTSKIDIRRWSFISFLKEQFKMVESDVNRLQGECIGI